MEIVVAFLGFLLCTLQIAVLKRCLRMVVNGLRIAVGRAGPRAGIRKKQKDGPQSLARG
jgi:hypothetical protein